jgi:type II secretory pathway pseudopilin PulG
MAAYRRRMRVVPPAGIVMGVALVMTLVATAMLAVATRNATVQLRAQAQAQSLRAAQMEAAGAGVQLPPEPTPRVVPLQWTPASGNFQARMTVGSSPVTAVFDTGSAAFIVATAQCASCSGAVYDPTRSAAAIALFDPRKLAAAGPQQEPAPPVAGIPPTSIQQYAGVLCEYTAAYVSQSDQVRLYQDTVSFPRVQLTSEALCTTGVDGAIGGAAAAPALVITDFPVGGVVSSSSAGGSLNVLGMSAVDSVSTTVAADGSTRYLLPSCQTTRAPALESPVLQAADMYYSALGVDTVWTQCLGVSSGFMALAAVLPSGAGAGAAAQCGAGTAAGSAVPLVQSLSRASSALGRTPWRYYVVALQSVTVVGAGGSPRTQLAGMPAYLVLDTGTTQCQLPGAAGAQNAATLNSLGDGEAVIFRLGTGVSGAATNAEVVLTGAAGVSFPSVGDSSAPVFTHMPDSEATMFSSALDVGVFGATAMRGLCIQFNVTRRTAAIIATHMPAPRG